MFKEDSFVVDEGDAQDDDRDLLSIASPLSSKGYFDSPVESSVDDDDILLSDIQMSSNKKTPEHLSNGRTDLLRSTTIPIRSSNQPENDDCNVKLGPTNVNLTHKFENFSSTDHVDHVIVSQTTKELIDRSRQELERRRQKRLSSSSQMSCTTRSNSSVLEETPEPQRTNASVAEPVPPQNPFENPVLIATFFQEQNSVDTPTSDESMIVTHDGTDALKDSDATIASNNFVIGLNDLDTESPESRPMGSLSERSSEPAPEGESSHRRASLFTETENSTTSLDYETVFGSKRTSSVYTKHDSSYQSMISTLSHQIPVFGDQQDPTCRGRGGWIIFMMVVMLLVVLLAALVNKPTTPVLLTPTASPSVEPPIELPTEPPSTQPTSKPRTQAPVPFVPRPSTTPTPSPASTFPPFAFPFLTFPPLNSPAGSNQFTSAPVILAAQGVTPSLPTTTVNPGLPTPIMPSVASTESPPTLPRWTFPPSVLVQPTARNLRSGRGEVAI